MTRPIICLQFLIFGILFAIKHEHVSFAALDHTLMIPVFLSVAYEILWKTELAYSGFPLLFLTTWPDCKLFTWRHNVRRLLNIKWYDFVTNDSVRSQTKLTDLPLIIAKFHQTCQPHYPPALCQPLAGQMPCPWLEASSPPGRPRKTWIQQVEEDHGCAIDLLWSSAQDRSLWRSLVLATALAGQAQQWVSEFLACSSVFMHLEFDKTVKFLIVPSALTWNDLINVLCDLNSVIDTVLWNIGNPQQAMHLWTATMLEFNAIPKIFEVTKRSAGRFKKL